MFLPLVVLVVVTLSEVVFRPPRRV
jgi:hypothetical protein